MFISEGLHWVEGKHFVSGTLWLDPCYKGLGSTEKECEERYMERVKASISEGEWKIIRQAVQRVQLTGSNRFVEEVAKKIGRRVKFRG